MNIKVAAFTVSKKSSNNLHFLTQQDDSTSRNDTINLHHKIMAKHILQRTLEAAINNE